MEYRNFLFLFCVLATRCAAEFDIGSCKFRSLDIGLIEETIKDDAKLAASYNFTGGLLTVTPVEDDDDDGVIIEAVVVDNQLKLTSNTDFTEFEKTVENHSDNLVFEKQFILICDSVNSENLIVRLTIEDVNNHEPTFTSDSYTYNLPKKLSPEVDLTTVIYGDPIIAEDVDFSNKELKFTIVPSSDIFVVDTEPMDGNRFFKGVLKVTKYTTINESITLQVTATDGGDPKKSQTTTVYISAPHMLGDCTLEDDGKLDFGFFQNKIKDNETLNFAMKYTGSLSLSTPLDDDTGGPYINVTLDKDNSQILFKTNDNFEGFDYDQRALQRQPVLIVYRSVELDCGGVLKDFTFGLAVEDTNNHNPNFTQDTYTYYLSEQLMPQVDLTSLGTSIIVEDVDFSNTMVTFSVDDSAFFVETVFEESEINKRQYKGVLRLSSYKNITDEAGISLTITATDNGEPPLEATATVILLADKGL